MKRAWTIFLKGAGMGAADAVPGVSGGTIAFITGIYAELIETIKRFGPGALSAWQQGGARRLTTHLNLRFLLPLLAGIAISLISVAHLITYLMAAQPVVLSGFFFGLVAASALVIRRDLSHWRLWHILPLLLGLISVKGLALLMPLVGLLGNESLMLVVAGAIAISAMLLPGVSGSFLLLAMGLYGTVMQAIKSLDFTVILVFGGGCALGLFGFSRLLSWLLRRFYTATLQFLIGMILGALPILWPWQELVSYRVGPQEQLIPMGHRFLLPHEYAQLTGDSAQPFIVLAAMLAGLILVLMVGRKAPPEGAQEPAHVRKKDECDA
ncbi:DUF368 domain-containing protein [Pistricoccus aurantiacus]|uniref:DUF368 domain-containing protein n=1 Tax=Pistricoccus aurantiacus TaxID=1883414 RepID=UPI0036272281